MRCSDFRDQLTRSAGERAAAQVEREAASHLATCPACARYATSRRTTARAFNSHCRLLCLDE